MSYMMESSQRVTLMMTEYLVPRSLPSRDGCVGIGETSPDGSSSLSLTAGLVTGSGWWRMISHSTAFEGNQLGQ